MTDTSRPEGRPTKYTPETVAIILRGLEQGLPRKRAAALALIGESTMQSWLSQYPEFVAQVEQAEATDMSGAMLRITKHAATEFKRIQSRYPHDFPKPTETVKVEGTHHVTGVRFVPDELDDDKPTALPTNDSGE